MKKLIVICSVIIIAAGFLGYTIFFKADTLQTAIAEYEDGDYENAVIILNTILPSAGYNDAEKIYYYRCKSLTRLAESLEKKYDDELKTLGIRNHDAEDRAQTILNIKNDLKEINDELNSDLVLISEGKRGRIVSGGKFYSQFVERYRGSRYIEDIDFEEVEKTFRVDRENFLRATAVFYKKYPDTSYISQLVTMLFDFLKTGGVGIRGNDDLLTKLVVHFCKKYPTSSEFQRIFVCNGENVNLRNSPGINGQIVGKVEKQKILVQLEKSMDSVQIGESRDYWYRVSDLNGLQGWIFGKFLNEFEVANFNEVVEEERWTLDEHFQVWHDSNTPENWVHPPDSAASVISFYEKSGSKIAKISAGQGIRGGLFRRMTSPYSFVISAKGRYLHGNSVILFAYVFSDNKSGYCVKLNNQEVDVNGRKIPYQTSVWHDYRLECGDGKFAKIYIDGELISGRIPAVQLREFNAGGLYCLYSMPNSVSGGEMEYIRMR